MSNIKKILITILLVLGLIIIFQNVQQVETKILFITITMPRALLLFGTLAIGFLIGMLSSFGRK